MMTWVKSLFSITDGRRFWFMLSRTLGLTMLAIIACADIVLPELMERSDYSMAFYVAGHMVAHGQSNGLYPPPESASFTGAAFDKYTHQLLKHLDSGGTSFTAIYMYSPLNAWLFAPFSFLEPRWSLLVWQMLSVAALAMCCRIMAKIHGDSIGNLFWMSMLFFPVFHTLLIGQMGVIFGMLPVCLGYAWLCGNKPLRAGLVWSVLLLKPQFAPVAAVICLSHALRGRYRCLAGLVLGSFIFGMINIFVLGPEVAARWLHCLRLAEKTYEFPSYLLVCLPGALLLAVPAGQRAIAKLPIYGLSAAVGLSALWQSSRLLGRACQQAHALALVLSSFATPLVVPHLLFYDLTCLVPAGFLIYARSAGRQSDKLSRVATLVWLAINLYMAVFFLIGPRWAPPLILTAVLLAAYLAVFAMLWREHAPAGTGTIHP